MSTLSMRLSDADLAWTVWTVSVAELIVWTPTTLPSLVPSLDQ